MEYRHPLPAGIAEPDASAVTMEAFQGLIGATFGTWSDKRLLAEADYHASLAVRPDEPVRPEDVLLRRASEMAEHFLRATWAARQGPTGGEAG